LKIAKPQAGKFNWAATAGIPYFAFAGFLQASDIDMTYVPYRDFTPALSDVDEGRIDVASTALTQLLPHEQAGHGHYVGDCRGPATRSTGDGFAPGDIMEIDPPQLKRATRRD
jgi:hypothetical protein